MARTGGYSYYLNIIHDQAFAYSGLVNVTVPDSVTELGNRVFNGCPNLQSFDTGSGITALPIGIVAGCKKLNEVVIRDQIYSFGNDAFGQCTALNSISIPDTVTDIGDNTFYNCTSLKNIKFSRNITSIGKNTFQNTNLKSITLPDKVTKIDSFAFANMPALTDLYLPKSISQIESNAFSGSPNIRLNIFSDCKYAVNFADKNQILWKSRDKYTVTNPKSIKAESVGKNKVRLSWSKVSGADKYMVQCWRNGKLQYKYTTKNNYLTDPKASDTVTNTYKVYSRNTRSDGTVVYSSQPAVVSALGICPKVTNVRANSTSSGAQIKWNKSYYNDGYIIYRSVNKNGTGAVFAGTTRDVKFTDRKAKKGQLYYYWVYPYHNKNGKMILGEKPAERPRAKMK